ncbi:MULTISPECIES: dTMP kinase [Amycolatopsis]|uniref:Thymidylate kinase n=1 Tax=Amycolatopsis echigonensis TaxID=2576905 RepID=A0A2N3WLK1_9PSEU|nr:MULTISPECIES: dTMP kinase [Amycolatopsis]MBB2500756.1 dTMP kinase [Amycolatopsis echigonensis]MCG3751286.1 dTMP kinase [Amycolatopsis sp. Poz14]PKV94753.1 thymidylate kinase [Amycolatopsis niigatensis]
MTPSSSDLDRGLLISVDGPGGAGKTTIVRHLAQILLAEGRHVHVTAEPSNGPIGKLAAELTPTVTGHALACLYAADRYHHVETEIKPRIQTGHVVISDRYLASGLVVQRFDGVDPVFLWQINEEVERPDLTVILEADPDVISERLHARGPHNRFQSPPGNSRTETKFYREARTMLDEVGFPVLTLDCSNRPPEQSAAIIRDELNAMLEPADSAT